MAMGVETASAVRDVTLFHKCQGTLVFTALVRHPGRATRRSNEPRRTGSLLKTFTGHMEH